MKNPMEKHENFILDKLLPLLSEHSRTVNVPTAESAMAAFLALATVLQSRGINEHALMAAIKASKPETHPEPETMQ